MDKENEQPKTRTAKSSRKTPVSDTVVLVNQNPRNGAVGALAKPKVADVNAWLKRGWAYK